MLRHRKSFLRLLFLLPLKPARCINYPRIRLLVYLREREKKTPKDLLDLARWSEQHVAALRRERQILAVAETEALNHAPLSIKGRGAKTKHLTICGRSQVSKQFTRAQLAAKRTFTVDDDQNTLCSNPVGGFCLSVAVNWASKGSILQDGKV